MGTTTAPVLFWAVAPDLSRADALDIGDAAATADCVLVAHPRTLEALGRAASPFGPMARSVEHTARALGARIQPDVSYPEGLVAAVAAD